ncbi:hypothetical protein BDQ17DRAFT_1357966 [Cyathus striatus]|nr:hypothetical protein BDQ17DRAFT_1357966 [Cyathus striatus]
MGHGHGPLKVDPAIERFDIMRENAYLHFRWTPRTVKTAIFGFIVFPVATYYIADRYYRHWNWVGKLKGESLTVYKSQ